MGGSAAEDKGTALPTVLKSDKFFLSLLQEEAPEF